MTMRVSLVKRRGSLWETGKQTEERTVWSVRRTIIQKSGEGRLKIKSNLLGDAI